MKFKFTHQRRYKTSVGKTCMHCNKSATVTARRHTVSGKVMLVRYCVAHADEIIGPK